MLIIGERRAHVADELFLTCFEPLPSPLISFFYGWSPALIQRFLYGNKLHASVKFGAVW
jgi:hypothetical protein